MERVVDAPFGTAIQRNLIISVSASLSRSFHFRSGGIFYFIENACDVSGSNPLKICACVQVMRNECADLDGSSITDYSTLPDNRRNFKEELFEPSASNTRRPSRDQIHDKVNIVGVSADVRSSGKEVVSQEEQNLERCGIASHTIEYVSLDDELEALFAKDWNNNLNGERIDPTTSKVKMMVQHYEQNKGKVSRPTRTLPHEVAGDTANLCMELAHPDVSSIGDAETSDFESASVTSGSSVCGDGGRRSVRTSSAFSEGSRDVASIDRFDLGMTSGEQQKQQEDLTGHNTMITININYRCDTNAPRTSKATSAEKDVAGKTVDILVSAPPQAVTEIGRKSLQSDKAILQQTSQRHVLDTPEVEEKELMDLEQERELTDELISNESEEKTNEVAIDDAGSESVKAAKPKDYRGSLTNNRSCRTPDDEEYHDCDDLHESTLSFYEQAFSQPVTPQEQQKRSAGVHASNVECSDELDGEQPMIQIVQELSEDHSEVTSTITLSKAQIRNMQKANGARRSADAAEELKRHSPPDGKSANEKRRKSHCGVTTKKRHDKSNLQRQQRIMDDNFCNEILDSTIHFDRLYGNNRPRRPGMEEQDVVSSPSPTRPMAEERFSDSIVCEIASPGEESFDSVMSVGKLEGKPRYSGKTVGRLMMKRLKKLQGAGVGTQKMLDSSDASTSSSQHMSGPKKPPRTFANSPKRSSALPVPSCPTAKDVEELDPLQREIGWKLDTKPRSHQVGWTVPAANGKNEAIPAQIYSMLNYSEDEGRKQLIKTGNSKPAPQQSMSTKAKSKYWPDGEPLGPKMTIDTVDGTRTPSRRHSTSTDFERFVRESNVKSTPHRKSDLSSRIETRRRIEQFLSEERHQVPEGQRKLPGVDRRRRTTGGIFERRRQQQENFLDDARRTNHEPRRKKTLKAQGSAIACKNACCPAAAATTIATTSRINGSGGKVEKRRTFRKAAILKRTRTLFEASKKKIWAIKRFETPKKQNFVGNTSPSDPSDRDPNINRNSTAKKKYNLHHKHLGYTPVHLRCKTCGSEQADGNREEAVVPTNYRPTRQLPFSQTGSHSTKDENKENKCSTANRDDRRRKSGEENNRKSARSLNFASVPQAQRMNPSPVEREIFPDKEASPRKTGKHLSETKFLKTLRNLKISPKRIFRFGSQSSTVLDNHSTASESHVQGEFQSYDDLNLDSVANMGDFLSNIRRRIACDEVDQPIIGRESLQQAAVGRSVVPVVVHDEHEDPIYQEISPKANKMVLNEFISSDTNKRYLMVNNNPNILYAMVESKAARSSERLVRARSLTNMHSSVNVADPTITSTPVSKPQNNTSKSHMKPTNRRVTMSPHMEGRALDQEEQQNSLYNTALSENVTSPGRRTSFGLVNSGGTSGRTNRSFNATESTTSSSIRRSLFSRKTPSDHNRSLSQQQQQQHQHSTDDSDISILQEEESREDESSLESLPEEPNVNEPLIVRERFEDRLAFRKENEHFQQNPPASASTIGSKGRYKGTQEDLFAFEKDIIVEQTMGGKNVKAGIESGAGMGQNLIVLKAHKSVQVKVDGNGAAPLGCFDTDGEIDSLRKYDDREIEELVHSLHDNVTLSDQGTTTSSSMGNELDTIGYDTVDLAPPVSRVFHQPASKNLTIDTVDVSELISHAPEDSLSIGNLTPITSSPSSAKMSTSGTAVMRNLKDKLRSSFRKSRTFIKNERQRITNYLLEDRSGSKSPSVASSTTSSPRRHTSLQTHANTVGHKQGSRRKQESDIESDDMYQSFTQGSNSIVTASSMTELSSQHMNELMQQIIRQGDARKQLKQAVAICRSTREFECSPELIEAERLLLVATQKETAVRNELNKIDYLTNGMTLTDGKRVGTVTLSNFEFPLKETAVRDALFNYFYVVVCTYKHEVKATIAKERFSDGRVYFRDCAIQFKNLDANYEIKVEVFVLQLRKNVKNYSFESRYHLEKDTKRPVSCPSPSKKLRDAGRMLSFRSNSPKSFDFDNEFSRFKSQGFLTLTSFMLLTASGTEGEDASGEEKPFDATYATARSNHTTQMSGDDVGHSYYSTTGHLQPTIYQQDDQSVVLKAEDFKYLTLDSMAYTSNMVGTIGMNVRSEVRFEGSDMRGFLDVGEKVDGNEGITWNRRWCQMNGFMLEFWNYPQECQEKQPILYIDLVKCINERIDLAERTICSRPRTVRVEIFSSRIAAAGASCNSSGIGSLRSSGRTTSPSSVGELAGCSSGQSHLRPISPGDGGRNHNNVTCYLLAADSQSDLKGWMNELNRVVKFLKEWKI
uniref:PH domain-containing protein n=1 Tax=Anopheles minimus TaxID=112268 RepID=A0A182WLD0_9DIPT